MRPELWRAHSKQQIYLTSLLTEVLGEGPAATVSAEIPDLHHFRGSFGGKHIIPLWRNAEATQPNVTHGLLDILGKIYGAGVRPEELFAYAYAVLASPSYTERFWDELTIPGPRLPLTKDSTLFRRGVELGRVLIHLHTYGERFTDGHVSGRMTSGKAKLISTIASTPEAYPEDFDYNEYSSTLRVGTGEISPVDSKVYNYSISGYEVLPNFLSHRMKDGSGRTSSPLDKVRPSQWTRPMTDELLELIWILEATVGTEPEIAAFVENVVAGELFTANELPQPTAEECDPPKGIEEEHNPYQMSF